MRRISHYRRVIGVRYYHGLGSSTFHHCSCAHHVPGCVIYGCRHFTLSATARKFMREGKFATTLHSHSLRVKQETLINCYLTVRAALSYLLYSNSRIGWRAFWRVVLDLTLRRKILDWIILNLSMLDAHNRLLVIFQNSHLLLLIFIRLSQRHGQFLHVLQSQIA